MKKKKSLLNGFLVKMFLIVGCEICLKYLLGERVFVIEIVWNMIFDVIFFSVNCCCKYLVC